MTTLALTAGAQLALALLGAALLAWDALLARRGRTVAFGVTQRMRDRALLGLGVLGAAAYTNFGRLHGEGAFLHYWDTYHYYIGAKYFPELGHERLYECTATAEDEAGGRHDVATRGMTDLRTNLQTTTFDILEHPERCKRHFTAARWQEFKHDISWFRDRLDSWTWRKMQRDHGYNATPVWTVTGHALANLAPASDLLIRALALIDPLLLLASLLLLGRSFGWRVAAVAALALGTYYPARFYWNGGAFLRFDWLFFMIAGVCALRKERPLLGGMALGYAALLRLFPAALFVGPALLFADHFRRTRTWQRAPLRLFAGAALVTAIALPPSLALTGDWGAGFLENTRKHAETPLANHMGLPTVLSYRPSITARALDHGSDEAVWPLFKAERRAALHQLRPLLALVALALLAALVLAGRRGGSAAGDGRGASGGDGSGDGSGARGGAGGGDQTLWRVTTLSLILVPAFLQLTCYYYVFIILWATLSERRPALGAILLGLCAVTMEFVFVLLSRVGMDEAYVAMSLATLLAMGVMLWMSLRKPTAPVAPAASADEPVAPTAPAAPVAPAAILPPSA